MQAFLSQACLIVCRFDNPVWFSSGFIYARLNQTYICVDWVKETYIVALAECWSISDINFTSSVLALS